MLYAQPLFTTTFTVNSARHVLFLFVQEIRPAGQEGQAGQSKVSLLIAAVWVGWGVAVVYIAR